MKICSKCKCKKQIDEFAWRSIIAKTRHSQCHECRRETARQSYIKNRGSVIEGVRIRNESYKIRGTEWKSKLYCVICNENYIKCIDFHHLDGKEKTFEVSGMISKYPLDAVLKEAAKCIVTCANCHRKIHGGIIEVTDELINRSKLMIDEANNSL